MFLHKTSILWSSNYLSIWIDKTEVQRNKRKMVYERTLVSDSKSDWTIFLQTITYKNDKKFIDNFVWHVNKWNHKGIIGLKRIKKQYLTYQHVKTIKILNLYTDSFIPTRLCTKRDIKRVNCWKKHDRTRIIQAVKMFVSYTVILLSGRNLISRSETGRKVQSLYI